MYIVTWQLKLISLSGPVVLVLPYYISNHLIKHHIKLDCYVKRDQDLLTAFFKL